MRRALLACASLSIAAHALTFTLLPQPERTVLVRVSAVQPTAWQMRVTAKPRHTIDPTKAAPDDTLLAANIEPEQEPEPALTTEIPVEQSTPPAPNTTELPPPPVQASLQPDLDPPVDKGGAEGDQAGLTEYIPRPQLSLPPVPQRTAIIVPPSGNYPTDRIVGTLSLYIDETGKVHHILPNGASMPPEFEEAAKQAFMPLTFRPGILNGVPVKSRIRIEVVFDNTPLPEAPTKPEGSDQRP